MSTLFKEEKILGREYHTYLSKSLKVPTHVMTVPQKSNKKYEEVQERTPSKSSQKFLAVAKTISETGRLISSESLEVPQKVTKRSTDKKKPSLYELM